MGRADGGWMGATCESETNRDSQCQLRAVSEIKVKSYCTANFSLNLMGNYKKPSV